VFCKKLLGYFLRGFPLNSYLPLSSIVLGNVTVCSEICRRFEGRFSR
jgi:hypothetical protein